MARIGAITLAILGLLVCVFVATASATEPDRTPPTVSLSGTAVKAVEEGKSTGSYQLHVTATDGSKSAPQSGVAKIEVAVDGSGQQSWEKYCPEGSCGLEETWTYSPGNYSSEGPRWVTVRVTDHAGNATEQEISLEGIEEVPREAAPTAADRTPPTITLAGSAEKAVWHGATSGKYELRMFATDGSRSSPQSGVAKIEVAVDGTTLQSWEKYCPVGSCRLMVTWPYSPGNFSGTHHYIVVTARDHAGNVATKKIEWDPTPPVVSASGELKNLENQYINGQGTKTVAISATDNHSGVRLLSLEDEGHGILVSKTPAGCVLKPLKDEECPLATSETLTADTTKMPEGANHLRVLAEDFAGNVTRGQAWTVYVDRTPPSFEQPVEISVVRPPGAPAASVILPEAKDPPLADGTPGSGVFTYSYRYSLSGGIPTEWQTSPYPYFEVQGARPGELVAVEAYATDKVGNQGSTVSASAEVPKEESVPTESEEEENLLEEEVSDESFESETIVSRRFEPKSQSTSAFAPDALLPGQADECTRSFGWPHDSTHKPTRINAVASVKCEGIPVAGYVRTILFESGRIVADSGERQFIFLHAYPVPQGRKATANAPCRKDQKWRAYEIIEIEYDADLIGGPPIEFKDKYVPPNGAIPIKCGENRS